MKYPSDLRGHGSFRNEELWESEHILDSTRLTRRILDAKYQKSDLRKTVSNIKHLNNNEQSILHDVLTRYELLLDGTLGTWRTKHVDIELQAGAKPYRSKPYPVPRAHDTVFHKEVERLCQLGVLKND